MCTTATNLARKTGYLLTNDVFISSCLITTETAKGPGGCCELYICSGQLDHNYKKEFKIDKDASTASERTVQGIQGSAQRLLLKAGSMMFIGWKFNAVHPSDRKPKWVKVCLTGSILTPAGHRISKFPAVGGYIPF
jgi:hypothetical protein